MEYYYDFIEIGTANFDTLTHTCADFERGLAIEPVKHYLDQLPNKPYVTKINCAISPINEFGHIDVYYIPEHLVEAHNLPWWIKGCNSIGEYHRHHIANNLQHLVKIDKVEVYPISHILEKHKVKTINFLKIDTEGNDLGILINLSDYLKTKSKDYFPKKIRFETSNTDEQDNKEVIELYESFGYLVDYTDTDDTQIILKD